MKVISVIGRKQTGKTTFVCSLCKTLPLDQVYVLDINNEYFKHGIKNEYKGPADENKFLDHVVNVKNSVIIFEEAASYFSSRESDQRLKKLLQRTRHQNNVVFLIFHGLADFPANIYTRSDYIALFKTLDFQSSLDSRFRKNEQFIEEFQKVKNAKNQHFYSFFIPL